jgi:hypothetical protein
MTTPALSFVPALTALAGLDAPLPVGEG